MSDINQKLDEWAMKLLDIVERMLAAEREACAKIVKDEGECRHVDHVTGFCACQSKADAIRARGGKT